ncbi:2-hydroxyacid dehydrogenase [Celeribacter indicus]|uniref:D-isomer specific 2-hydroxyacid dehydrogenase n=1 Tax=Celeribacter indicus TaxID=1208324 RepID=A0A0B5E4Y4_9RHOB|nr:glyoxylate/hydroxypyruvate reductase A [Celeribacter indicus]AJE48415.1 D-isomer specific 2-hydroxyacid dehydrogenase [Celeribacter indicus]SDX29862.1 glyoxylate/hydroxypyruvate reductase A [Celeribacter indicus]
MSPTVLFSAPDRLWPAYATALPAALARAGIAGARLTREAAPDTVDYIVYAPNDALRDFTPFTRTKAVLSLWAGVEKIAADPTLTQPLCRMVEPGLALGMRDYVVGHVMRYHLGTDRYVAGPRDTWERVVPPLARDRKVTVLGLGELGATCAAALAGLGFRVTGWSRRPKDLPGIACLAGPDALSAALGAAEILVLLLPDTSPTRSILNADRLAALPQGACLVNPGRGTLVDDDALLAALDSGHVAHATLDVFRTEPLPPGHRYWSHPRVTVTPHVAADTRPDTASDVIAENIRRGEAGEPFLHLVDRAAGY